MYEFDKDLAQAEMNYRSARVRDGIVGRRRRAQLKVRRARRLDGIVDPRY
jgi:hypothetical protein